MRLEVRNIRSEKYMPFRRSLHRLHKIKSLAHGVTTFRFPKRCASFFVQKWQKAIAIFDNMSMTVSVILGIFMGVFALVFGTVIAAAIHMSHNYFW